MAVSSKFYAPAVQSVFNKEIDWDTDAVRVVLLDSGYVPDQDADRYKSDLDLGANEVVGDGYVAGGVLLTGKTFSYDAGTKTMSLHCDDVMIGNPSSISADYAVFFVETAGADATDPLICYWDFGETKTSSDGPFELLISPAGLVTAIVGV